MPLPSKFGLTGVAATDLTMGLGSRIPGALGGLGDELRRQVGDETEDEKLRKRLGLSITQSGSLAVQSLFGGAGGRGY